MYICRQQYENMNKIHDEELNCIGLPGQHISPDVVEDCLLINMAKSCPSCYGRQKNITGSQGTIPLQKYVLLKIVMYFREMQGLVYHYLNAITFPNIDLCFIFDDLDNSLIETSCLGFHFIFAFLILPLIVDHPFSSSLLAPFPLPIPKMLASRKLRAAFSLILLPQMTSSFQTFPLLPTENVILSSFSRLQLCISGYCQTFGKLLDIEF